MWTMLFVESAAQRIVIKFQFHEHEPHSIWKTFKLLQICIFLYPWQQGLNLRDIAGIQFRSKGKVMK